MTQAHPRPGARGSRDAKRAFKIERAGEQLHSDGALTNADERAEKARREAVPCPKCGEMIHPTNYLAHRQVAHNDETLFPLLHEASERLPLVVIRMDGGTQPRSEINTDTVTEYAEAMRDGASFPPIDVYYDGQSYWLADGFHRVQAARQAELLDINALVHMGTQRDAILHSAGANGTHGLRRTNEDKRRAVTRLLKDEEWAKWSDREIARKCMVSNNFVSVVRRSLSPDDSENRTYTTKHGTTATMQTGNIGKTRVTYGPSEDDYQPEVPSAQVEDVDPAEAYAAATTWEEAQKLPLGKNRYSENESEWKLGGRGAPVKAASGQEGTLAFASGRIAFVDTKNGRRQYDVENLTRLDGVVIPTSEVIPPTAPNYKRDGKSTHAANEYVPQGQDACQTPAYAIDPLLPYLPTDWMIWEPAAGEGLLAEALFDSGFGSVETSDILTGQNFFEYAPPEFDAIVTNPPFTLKFKWLERCYELGRPFALLVPVEALGAKKAQDLMQKYGFEIMLLNRRVHFKMPNKGWEGSAQFPVCWLCWKLLPEQVMFGNIEYPLDIQPETEDEMTEL